MKTTVTPFGFHPNGTQASLFVFETDSLKASFTDFGARLVSLEVLDKSEKWVDVVLGYDAINGYLNGKRYYGSNPGPFANRIKNAAYTINGTTFQLEANEGKNQLHGGKIGFDQVFWETEIKETGICFYQLFPDGEAGRPGNLKVWIEYRLEEKNTLRILFTAQTDKATHVNITNHSYFNLNTTPESSALNHLLFLNANEYLETDDEKIPTGKKIAVKKSSMDFTAEKRISDDFLNVPGGYDHCYIINRNEQPAARLTSAETGICLTLTTDLPGMQLYTGSNTESRLPGKKGLKYPAHSSICLEPQFYPDSPNRPEFPSTLLKPEEVFEHFITLSFSISE